MSDMREEFEAWAFGYAKNAGYGYLGRVTEKFQDGGYTTSWVDSAWLGWQAALKAKGQNHG